MADIDFKRLASSCLAQAETLLREWLPQGHKAGPEWKSINPTRADRKEGSFSVNFVKGKWGDFASGDAGNDLVSLYAYLFCGNDQVQAAKEIAERLNMPECVPPLEKTKRNRKKVEQTPPKAEQKAEFAEQPPADTKPRWVPVLPVPIDAPPSPLAHEFRGKPESVWPYLDQAGRLLGIVCRFRTSDGGKEVIPLTYCQHEKSLKFAWRWIGFNEPRPLYGLDRLADKPTATVLLVEGEKCADAAAAQLPELAVVSWPGGGKAVRKVDWSPLAGRKVITWADCDAQREKLSKEEKAAGVDPMSKPLLPEEKQPGVLAMATAREILHGLGCKLWNVEIPKPGTVADGLDVADVIAAGTTGELLAECVRSGAKLWNPPEPISTAPEAPAGGRGKRDPADEWRDRLLWRKGDLVDCLANVYDVLANRKEWRGVVAFDEFAQRTVKLKPPPYAGGEVGEWDSTDDSRTAIWVTRQEYLTSSSSRVAEAIETLAHANTVHPVREWLQTLPPHDGVPRIDHWLVDFLGVRDSEYVRRVSRFYLLGMIARVMDPGCKFDYCLVLEGKQGKGKSTAFRILGGEWYGDTDLDLHNKDSMSALRGKWVYEFAELGAVTRAESTKQKSFLSRQVDEYRPVYGRREIRAPRQVVFGGTTNEWEWNKDPTGGRRFWPVECVEEFNLQGLQDAREQMFAEALALYLAKERYWPNPEEQMKLFDPEQLAREQPESLIDALHDWVDAQVADFSIATAVMDGLKLDASKLSRDLQTRVGTALRKLGCTKVEKRNGMVRYWYKPPVRNGAASESSQPAQQETGGYRAPF